VFRLVGRGESSGFPTNNQIAVETLAQVDQLFHLAYVKQQKEDSIEHQQQWVEKKCSCHLQWEAWEQADQPIHALLAPIAPLPSVPVEIDLNPQPCRLQQD
jgi:hypothetical protein